MASSPRGRREEAARAGGDGHARDFLSALHARAGVPAAMHGSHLSRRGGPGSGWRRGERPIVTRGHAQRWLANEACDSHLGRDVTGHGGRRDKGEIEGRMGGKREGGVLGASR